MNLILIVYILRSIETIKSELITERMFLWS